MGQIPPGEDVNSWARQRLDEILKVWPILAALLGFGIWLGSWAIGVNDWIHTHDTTSPIRMKAEKAQMINDLDLRYLRRDVLDERLRAIQAELARLADEVEKMHKER